MSFLLQSSRARLVGLVRPPSFSEVGLETGDLVQADEGRMVGLEPLACGRRHRLGIRDYLYETRRVASRVISSLHGSSSVRGIIIKEKLLHLSL